MVSLATKKNDVKFSEVPILREYRTECGCLFQRTGEKKAKQIRGCGEFNRKSDGREFSVHHDVSVEIVPPSIAQTQPTEPTIQPYQFRFAGKLYEMRAVEVAPSAAKIQAVYEVVRDRIGIRKVVDRFHDEDHAWDIAGQMASVDPDSAYSVVGHPVK